MENENDQKTTTNSETLIKNKSNLDEAKQITVNETSMNFENKGFEMENNNPTTSSNQFSRDRPGSMISIRSNASSSSRSSVNCISGKIRCPNFRMQKFFAYKPESGFQKASHDIKALILPEKDGNFIGNWLLVEISNWDFHREKIVLLTEKTIIVISYDFIGSKIVSYKRISLADLKKIKYGTLQYPKGSFMSEYNYGAVKLYWDDESKISLLQKWNPFGELPFIAFTSHHILYNEKEKETEFYNCDEFITSLEYAINKLPETEKSKIEFSEATVEVENYANLFAAWYNQNWIGYQLDRNGINF